MTKFVPVTPGGTVCFWLVSDTEDEAWEKLLEDAAHMPYRGKEGFIKRGYAVDSFDSEDGDDGLQDDHL